MSLTPEQQDCRNVAIFFEVFLKKLEKGYIPDQYDFREYRKQLAKFKECFEVKNEPKKATI